MKRVEPAPTTSPTMYAIRILFIPKPYHTPTTCQGFIYDCLQVPINTLLTG
jgi:hypothetical protein